MKNEVNEDEVKKRWQDYFSELLNREEPANPLEEHEIEAEEEDIALEEGEIIYAIKKLKNHKATGVDGIPGELIKYGGDGMLREMTQVYARIWHEERIPEEWQEGIYMPLHKKGDRHNCENYRGLCLLNIGYKILSSILCRKLLPHCLRIIGDYQAGFVPGKATIDNIFILRQLNEKYREYGRTSWHIYVD